MSHLSNSHISYLYDLRWLLGPPKYHPPPQNQNMISERLKVKDSEQGHKLTNKSIFE